MTTEGKRWAKYTERITAPVDPTLKADFIALSESMGLSASDHLRNLMERAVKRGKKWA